MEKYNVSIIVMDTLRYDAFVDIHRRMPLSNIGEFFIYDNCIAPSSWTLPSHASLLTGLYPSEHFAHETKSIKSLNISEIKLKKSTIVSKFKAIGYETHCISANPYVHPIYGFDEFDDFYEESYFTDVFGSVIEVSKEIKPKISKYRNMYGNNILKISKVLLKENPNLLFEAISSSIKLTPKALLKKAKAKFIDGWPLEKGGKKIVERVKSLKFKKPFFLLVNIMEAHDPYIGKKSKDFDWSTPFMTNPPSEKNIKKWKKLYKKGARLSYSYAFEMVEHIIESYGDDQIIILTSDHGQSLGENGFVGHGTVLYDEVIKVPLAIMLPKKFTQESKDYQTLINIPKMLLGIIEGVENPQKHINSKHVKSESFSIPANLYNKVGINKKLIKKYDKVIKRKF